MNQQVTPPPTTRSGLKHSIFAHIRRTMLTAIVALWALSAWAQGISYQAVLRDANGQIMANQEVKLRLSILNGATPVYQEEQTVTTTPQGVINIAIGEGSATDGTFADIDWSQAYDLLVEVDANESGTYAAMPTTPLRPVPQAYHAKWAENLKTSGSKGVTLEAQSTIDDDSLLFGVRNNKGDLVFAVYNNAVAVYVDTTPNGRPTQRAGFAVGGMAGRDGKQGKPLLQVDLSGTTVHVDDGAEATNGGRPVQKASFAVGGMAGRDSEQWQTLFNVDATGTKVHVDPPSEGGRPVQKASFAVGGMAGRATVAPLFRVDSVGTTVLVDDTSKAQGRPVQKASFAVGGMAGRAGDAANYFVVTKDSTRVYVDDRDARPVQKASFAVGGMAGRAGGGRYMDITKDNYIIGHGAGKKLMSGEATGKNNSIMGTDAGATIANGSDDNVVLGTNAAQTANSMTRTIAIGNEAGKGTSSSTSTDDIFIGYQAGMNNTKGANNVMLGNLAGKANTTGANNVFLGNQAGATNTRSRNNVFIGNMAGYSTNSTATFEVTNPRTNVNMAIYKGSNNVFLGNEAGYSNTEGNNNVFLGNYAGVKNTTATNNVFVGYSAGAANINGSNNVMMGNLAGSKNTSGASNVFVGDQAGAANTTASNNVFIGTSAGKQNTTGYNNMFLGNNSGQTNSTGSYNIFMGNDAGKSNTKGGTNLFIGQNAGSKNTTSSGNIFIGNSAGKSYNHPHQDGDGCEGNIFMGYNAAESWVEGEKNIVLGTCAAYKVKKGNGNILLGDFAGNGLTLPTDGSLNNRLLIGYQSKALLHGDLSNNRLTIASNTVNTSHTFYVSGTAGGTSAWSSSSDRRLKTNIRPLESALAKVMKLNGVNFRWKDETNHRPGNNVGFIAQEVLEVLPEVVSGGGKDENGNEVYYSVEYGSVVPVLVEAIKEQQKQIEELKKLVEQLMKK